MQLHRDREDFERAGVSLVAIGQGTPEQAAAFRREQGVEGLELLSDPERRTYKLLGAKKATMSELLGLRQIMRGMKHSRREGVRQGRTIGHPAQLGGVLVIEPGDAIHYAQLAEQAGDIPPNNEVLTAAREAVAAAS